MYKHPGVYVEHVPSGLLAIEATSTSTAAFIGQVRRGNIVTADAGKPVFIAGLDMFTKQFGPLDGKAGGIRDLGDEPDYFGHAVASFFANGGTVAYIVPVGNADQARAAQAAIADPNDPNSAFVFAAASPGEWPARLFVSLRRTVDDPDPLKDEYEVVIGYKPDPNKPIEPLERIGGMVLDPDSGRSIVSRIKDGSSLVTVSHVTTAEARSTSTVGETLSLLPTTLVAGDTLTVRVGNAPAVTVQLPIGTTSAQRIADAIEHAVRTAPNATPAQAHFVAEVSNDNRLILTSGDGAAVVLGGTGLSKTGLHGAYLRAPVPSAQAIGVLHNRTLRIGVGAQVKDITFENAVADAAAAAAQITAQMAANPAIPNFTASSDAQGLLLEVTTGDPAQNIRILGGTAAPELGFPDTTITVGTLPPAGEVPGLATQTLQITVGTAAPKTVTFAAPVADGAALATQIETQMKANPGAVANFDAAVSADGRLVLRAEGGGDANIVRVVGGSAASSFAFTTNAAARSAASEASPRPFNAGTGFTEARFLGGSDFGAPRLADYGAALTRLRDLREISILLLPGQFWAKGIGNPVIDEAITHSEFMQNRMVVFDSPPSIGSGRLIAPNDVKDLGVPTSPYAALYYPWLTVANPYYDKEIAANKPKTFDLPPSSFAAGIWARIDTSRGVWKAPAGLEAIVRGTQGPNVLISNDIQDNLNDLGVNCVRAIIGPSVLWGARTLATRTKPEFRYVPIRRTQSMIGESLYNALQAVVFEPNDHRLWASLRGGAGDFLNGLFRAGAFQGEKATEAYFVRCGLNATMTQGDIDAGIVRLVVGFAPLFPAEFVVVQVQQIVGQRG